jgi:cytoskeleton protein RodZ
MNAPQNSTAEDLRPHQRDVSNSNRVGDVLRAAREEQGISLETVANQLCIRQTHLDALEHNQFEKLPGLIYSKGFIRSYGEYLKLDGDTLLAQFNRENEGKEKDHELVFRAPVHNPWMPSKWVIVGALVMVLLMYLIWSGFSEENVASIPAPVMTEEKPATDQATTTFEPLAVQPEDSTAAPATDETPAAPAVAEAPKPTPEEPKPAVAATPAPETPAAASAAAPAKGTAIRALRDSWIEIKDSQGNVMFSRVLRAGETYAVPSDEVVLSTGNAGGLMLIIDGKERGTLGEEGSVRSGIKLAQENAPAPEPKRAISRPAPIPAPVLAPAPPREIKRRSTQPSSDDR